MSSATAIGGGEGGGCASVEVYKIYTTDFAIRDIVFRRDKAENEGLLSKHVIKKIIINTQEDPLYVDTFNAVFLQEELVSHAEALDLVTQYELDQIAALEEYLDQEC